MMAAEIEKWLEQNTRKCPVGRVTQDLPDYSRRGCVNGFGQAPDKGRHGTGSAYQTPGMR